MAKAKTNMSPIQETKPHFGYIKGTCKWAKVLQADDYGNFSISVYPDADSLEDHTELFEELRDKAKEEVEAAGKKVAGVADVFKEDQEGKQFFGFKLPEAGWDGKDNKIDIYDSKGVHRTDWDKLIGNGSTVKVKYMAKPYYMASTKMVGISLRFYAVQVINLVEYAGDGGDSGFVDETGGAPFDTDDGEF